MKQDDYSRLLLFVLYYLTFKVLVGKVRIRLGNQIMSEGIDGLPRFIGTLDNLF